MSNSIKVAHFSSGHEGGAGLAARRLNQALNMSGIDSKFFAISSRRYLTEFNEYHIPRNVLQKIFSGLITFLQQNLKTKYFFSLFSFNVLNLRLIERLNLDSTTIFHFHNWYNLVSQKNIINLANLGYKIVLTMHDERFYTGGCHYSFDCMKFKVDCSNCPELKYVLSKKPSRNLQTIGFKLQKLQNKIYFIAPSMWIKQRALESKLLSEFDVKFIPNTLGPNIQSTNRSKTLHPSNPIKIGIANFDIQAYIKGFDTIRDLEDFVSKNYQEFRIIYLKNIINKKDFEEKFWNEIDFLLVPSKIDNSPNVIHEAKAYGVPVIASLTGGITELLNFQYDIPISLDRLSANEIIARIRKWIKSKPEVLTLNRNIMRSQFESYISESVENHIKLYKEIAKTK